MKKLLAFILLAGCTVQLPQQTTLTTEALKTKALAWGDKYPEWDKALTDAVNSSTLSADVKHPCKSLSAKECLIQTISIMAKYESGFKPQEQYKEAFKDAKGNYVVSRGLLQISIESANQKAYACNIKDAKELHDPKINLECAVKIAVYWINKDAVFFGDRTDSDKNKKIYLGLGRYNSVARSSSKSSEKIKEYLRSL